MTKADEVSTLLNITGNSRKKKAMDNHTLDLDASAQNGYMSLADHLFAKARQTVITNFKTERRGEPLGCLKGDFVRIIGEWQ